MSITIALFKGCKAAGIKMPRPNGRAIASGLIGIVSTGLLGVGLTMAIAGSNLIVGSVLNCH